MLCAVVASRLNFVSLHSNLAAWVYRVELVGLALDMHVAEHAELSELIAEVVAEVARRLPILHLHSGKLLRSQGILRSPAEAERRSRRPWL